MKDVIFYSPRKTNYVDDMQISRRIRDKKFVIYVTGKLERRSIRITK